MFLMLYVVLGGKYNDLGVITVGPGPIRFEPGTTDLVRSYASRTVRTRRRQALYWVIWISCYNLLMDKKLKRPFLWPLLILSGLIMPYSDASGAVDQGGGFNTGKLKRIDTATLAKKIREKKDKKYDFALIDTRNESEYLKGSIPGAVNLPYKKHRFLIENVAPRTMDIVCYGYPGQNPTAVNAAIFLANDGYDQVWLYDGGYEGWMQSSESKEEERMTDAPAEKERTPEPPARSGVLSSK